MPASTSPTAFEQIFPRKELFRNGSLRAWLWGLVATLSLCLLLLSFLLITDLLISRGKLPEMEPEASLKLAETIGMVETDEAGEITLNPDMLDPEKFDPQNTGILPAVAWSQQTIWGGPFAVLYRNVSSMQSNVPALRMLIVIAIVLGLVRSWALSALRSVAGETGGTIATRLRRHIHRQTLRLGPSDLGTRESSQALQLFTTETATVQRGVMQKVQNLAHGPLEILLICILILTVDWRVAFLCIVPLAACWYGVVKARVRAKADQQLAEAHADAELRRLSETLQKTRLVRGYGMEDFEHQQFTSLLDRYRTDIARSADREGWARWVSRVLTVLGAGLLLFLIGNKILSTQEDFPVSAAVTVVLAFLWILPLVNGIWELLRRRSEVNAAAEKLQRYFQQVPEVSQAVGAKFVQPLTKAIQYEAVTFSTQKSGPPLLNGIDLKIPAGELTSLVSLDPQEAKALVYLLTRFIEPQNGRVLFDGEDIAWGTLESLRAEAVFVGSEEPFFTGTVYENITCGSTDYSLQDVTEAAKLSHAHNFVHKLTQGYETVLGEHGEQLDAGQSFRLALARAIIRNPALIIIEEPSEALDADTKALVDDAYNRIFPDRTVIFLPARLSTLRRSHRIVLIHQGRIEAVGPHEELVKKSPLYRHWEYTKFNEFRHSSDENV